MINFDPNHSGDFQQLGRIELPWDLVEQDLESVADEQTMNWSIIDNNTYNDDASKVQNEYKQYGYTQHNTRSWKTTNFPEKITFSWESLIIDALPMDHSMVAIHRQDPGQVLPWHFDRFFMLRKLYPDDTRPVWRFLMFLKDWDVGHILQVGDSMLHHWNRGDVVVWRPGVMHVAANIGLNKKWTANITGFLRT